VQSDERVHRPESVTGTGASCDLYGRFVFYMKLNPSLLFLVWVCDPVIWFVRSLVTEDEMIKI